MTENLNKRLIVLCDLGVGGERGRVLDRQGIAGALSATEYKDAMKVIKLQIRERERESTVRSAQGS